MGHLAHALGFRVGKSVPWSFNYHRYDFDAMRYINIYMAYDAYVKKSFLFLFNMISLKLLYSHINLRPYRRYNRLTIYVFNGFLDIYIRRFRLTILPKYYFFKVQEKYNFLRKALFLQSFYRNSVQYRQSTTRKYYRLLSRFLTWHFRYDFRNISFFGKLPNPLFVRFVHLSFRTITAKVLGYYITRRLKLGYSINSIVKPLINEAKKTATFRGIFIKFKGRLTRKQRASYNKRILKFGKIGFSTVSEKVDYAYTRYITRYGSCSIKIWICRRFPGYKCKFGVTDYKKSARIFALKAREYAYREFQRRMHKRKKIAFKNYFIRPVVLNASRNLARGIFIRYLKRLSYRRFFSLINWKLLLHFLARRRYITYRINTYLLPSIST